MNKDLLEYLEKVNAQEEQILRHEKPVLSYFVKGENSTVFDSGTVMAPHDYDRYLKAAKICSPAGSQPQLSGADLYVQRLHYSYYQYPL